MLNAQKWLFIFFALYASSCVVMRSEGDLIHADIDKLKNEIAALQRSNFDTQKLIDRRVASIEQNVPNVQKKNAESSMQYDKVMEEIQRISGQLEETQHTVAELRLQLDANKKAEGTTDKAAVAGRKSLPDDKKELFNYGKKSFDESDFNEAVAAFDSFLERFKSDDSSTQSAYFMRGDGYFRMAKITKNSEQQKDLYRRAILSFQRLITDFPDAKNNDAALFKVGQALEAMGLVKDSIVFYEEIINKYKKGEFAVAARKRLQHFKNGKKQ